MRLDPDVMRAVGAVVRVVVIARIPSDSLRSTWVEPGHARRLGRKEASSEKRQFVFSLLCSPSAMPGDASRIPARQCSVAVQELICFVMAMPHSLRRGRKPSIGDYREREGF